MKNRTTQILYSYWNEVRQGRLAPRRFDIEPSRIANILAETMILERTEDDTVRFRLAGTRIAEQFGTELRAKNFLDLWSPEDRANLVGKLTELQSRGGTLLLDIEAETASGRAIVFEAILLPLVHTRDVIDRFLGSISTSYNPMWLGSEPLTSFALARAEIVWPEGRPHAVAERMAQPPALDPATSSARIVRFERRQFRVVDGGRNSGNNT